MPLSVQSQTESAPTATSSAASTLTGVDTVEENTRWCILRHSLFGTLPVEQQDHLATLLQVQQYGQGQVIFEFGDPGHTMYFVCSGHVRFVMQDYTGAAITLEEIGEGDLFGEVALYASGSRTATAVAVEPTRLLALHERHLSEFLRVCPDVSEYLLRRMASRLTSSNQMLRHSARSFEEVVEAERSREDRAVLRMVENIATLPFFVANIVIIILWFLVSPVLERRFLIELDTPVFERLALILGIEGLLVSILVLINQRREAKDEGVRDRTEYEATLHADSSIKHLHEKMDMLIAEMRQNNENADTHQNRH
ncbi:MAG: hypothetical protein OHK0029_36260 [Armatimonadaceae bacterium]